MENTIAGNNRNSSTLQEWSNFLTVLNGKKNTDQPLLKKGESAGKIAYHLEKHFLKKVA